jgi:pimeloyl-ACP methyl ester carboxylesterase
LTTPRRHTFTLSLSLALLMAGSATMASAASDVELRPVEIPAMGVSTVVPAEWVELGGGVFARSEQPTDGTILVVQSAPVGVDQLWRGLLPQLMLDAIPEPDGTLDTDGFQWALYEVPVTVGERSVTVALAVAETGGATHLVLFQASPDTFELLRDSVFIPAVEGFAILAPEPTADPATLGYLVEDVSFPGGDEGVDLAGTLTRPVGPGPHPAVVLMSGSGAQDRDESLRPITTLKPFALIADALTSAGLAVLRYDDRGVGGSSGDYAAATIEDLAADGGAALTFLRRRDDIDPARIGVLGHSEGGLLAAKLAAQDPEIAFVIGLATPATDGISVIAAQSEAVPRSAGIPEAEIELAVSFAERALPLARDGDKAGLEEALRDHLGALWDAKSEADRLVLGDREAFVQRLVASRLPGMLSPEYRSILAYDPGPDWQRVQAPVLGLFGGKDVQVLGQPNAEALRAALAAGGNEDAEIVVLPDANHLFQSAETGAVGEYASLPPEFTPDLLPTIVAWLAEQLGLPGAS